MPGGTYFFTVNLLEGQQDLLVRHIDELHEVVRRTREERPFHIDAWVELPDHMHCIWTLPPGDDDFSNRWKSIKIRFVQAIPRTERRTMSVLQKVSGGYGRAVSGSIVSVMSRTMNIMSITRTGIRLNMAM